MEKRKPLSKKIRYDVFKRDSFTCQYCGRSAPDVVLEVDHIHPVSEGGTNDFINLITSCRDCNRGKGKRLISENDELKKQKAELEKLNEKREQREMMLQWKKDLLEIRKGEAELVNELITELTGFSLSEIGQSKIMEYLREFTLDEVYDAAETSYSRYYLPFEPTTEWKSNKNFNNALNKIGGICYNRRRQNGTV